ncbi:MAG: NAD(+) synthase [Desulfobacteraceae bacterium]
MQTGKIIDYIVQWLTEYSDTSGMSGFVVGVSGGVDSAVTSSLCAKTGKQVMALNMPICQASNQISLAREHITGLENRYKRVQGVEIDLTRAFETLKNTLPSEIQDDLSMANTRSRLRMLTLYAFASHYRLLVAGTGNKVEDFGVGFFTKYGDGGVDISPIADLMKSEVYGLAEHLGIAAGIMDAPPTDGLFEDNRTDEGQIGASYAELEAAMVFDKGQPGQEEEAGLNARQKAVLDIYRRLNQANQHKMEPVPVCVIPDAYR